MHSLAAKIISLTGLFIVTFVAGLLPLTLRQKRAQSDDANRRALRDLRRKQMISLSTCFAGGAFFASSMLELMPAVQKNFKAVFDNAEMSPDFPVAEFGISIGFFLILTIEQIIHVVKERPLHSHEHSHGHSDDYRDSTTSPLLQNSHTPSYGSKSPVINKSPYEIEHDSGESDSDNESDHLPSVALNKDHHIKSGEHKHGQSIEDSRSLAGSGYQAQDHDHIIFPDISKKHHKQRHYLRSYLLLVALSIHALFEGLAVGLFQDINNMIQVLGALIIHKCVLAFSMGINLVQHSFSMRAVVQSSFLFSVMSPVGFGIGILMLTYASSNLGRIFSAIFQAIATGTFLYVTFFEIFFHELNSKECHKLLKVLMMVLGYSLIAIVQYFENEME